MSDKPPVYGRPFAKIQELRARIFELEAENERYRDYGCWANEDLEEMAGRMERAEAKLATWRADAQADIQAFINSLHHVHDSGSHQSIWRQWQAHRGPYAEPLSAAIPALERARDEWYQEYQKVHVEWSDAAVRIVALDATIERLKVLNGNLRSQLEDARREAP